METKSGWKTTEFWLSLLAMLLGAIAAAGVVPGGSVWEKVIGLAVSALAAMGYSVSRGLYKKGEASVARAVEAKKVGAPADPT